MLFVCFLSLLFSLSFFCCIFAPDKLPFGRKATNTKQNMEKNIELHPFEPFLPKGAKLLMLGTFPPSEKRWCMKFSYPNFTNDMWKIFGLCYFNDKEHFIVKGEKRYDVEKIKQFLEKEGIAMYDTAVKVCRTKNTASDKDLEIIEPTNVKAMLEKLPQCVAVITAGQLATDTFCLQFSITSPKVGEYVEFSLPHSTRRLRLYRMPSSSRAYPMKVEFKAEEYSKVFGFIAGTKQIK